MDVSYLLINDITHNPGPTFDLQGVECSPLQNSTSRRLRRCLSSFNNRRMWVGVSHIIK